MEAGALLGTLDFVPPEQRKDATETDARSDLWSLGATLYHLVTGSRQIQSIWTMFRVRYVRLFQKDLNGNRMAVIRQPMNSVMLCVVMSLPLLPNLLRQVQLHQSQKSPSNRLQGNARSATHRTNQVVSSAVGAVSRYGFRACRAMRMSPSGRTSVENEVGIRRN